MAKNVVRNGGVEVYERLFELCKGVKTESGAGWGTVSL